MPVEVEKIVEKEVRVTVDRIVEKEVRHAHRHPTPCAQAFESTTSTQ